ncbi:hypothetical protein PFLUV_G00092370 [Perca fluviatilis]|uniref:Alpha-macroglobulin-like TED domain-containing protein n=1 Tax=Perca fluviatilis TaxID=8168 RepID=A0A6A5EH32_PERFL|nr:hypothetical protein PFLUV_G00092370 [Perca fluviatilis]
MSKPGIKNILLPFNPVSAIVQESTRQYRQSSEVSGKGRLPSLTNPYAVATTSYALANENKLNKEILYKFASTESSHWPTPKGHIYTLEATAYALLALVKAKAFEEAKPVVRWFNTTDGLRRLWINSGYYNGVPGHSRVLG